MISYTIVRRDTVAQREYPNITIEDYHIINRPHKKTSMKPPNLTLKRIETDRPL